MKRRTNTPLAARDIQTKEIATGELEQIRGGGLCCAGGCEAAGIGPEGQCDADGNNDGGWGTGGYTGPVGYSGGGYGGYGGGAGGVDGEGGR